ncbi:hypothetical protein MHYP_G00313080 [Metynnis hypsauchen]
MEVYVRSRGKTASPQSGKETVIHKRLSAAPQSSVEEDEEDEEEHRRGREANTISTTSDAGTPSLLSIIAQITGTDRNPPSQRNAARSREDAMVTAPPADTDDYRSS